MTNRLSKFEVYTITCSEDVKGKAKCKNFSFEPSFWGLNGNTQSSSTAQWKRILPTSY